MIRVMLVNGCRSELAQCPSFTTLIAISEKEFVSDSKSSKDLCSCRGDSLATIAENRLLIIVAEVALVTGHSPRPCSIHVVRVASLSTNGSIANWLQTRPRVQR